MQITLSRQSTPQQEAQHHAGVVVYPAVVWLVTFLGACDPSLCEGG